MSVQHDSTGLEFKRTKDVGDFDDIKSPSFIIQFGFGFRFDFISL